MSGQDNVRTGEILGPEPTSEDEAKVRSRFWPTLRKAARHIPFSRELAAAYYCALDPAVPLRVRATLLGALLYFVTPLDAVPDFILAIGFGDDVTVLLGAITLVAAHITDRHRERADEALAD
ncbi:YkvA family protein [Acuticoccus sp.]|uniref:YkvA family protein n=1 Tax=Acuticoccus sp. TaxID=1904378 RepID=UPI003B52FAF3